MDFYLFIFQHYSVRTSVDCGQSLLLSKEKKWLWSLMDLGFNPSSECSGEIYLDNLAEPLILMLKWG